MRADPTTPNIGLALDAALVPMAHHASLRAHLDTCETCMAAARLWQAGDFTDGPAFCAEGAKLHRAYTQALFALPPGALGEFLLTVPPLLETP